MNIGLRVLTRPNQEKLPEIYRTLGLDYAERVLPSIIQARGFCLRCWRCCCCCWRCCCCGGGGGGGGGWPLLLALRQLGGSGPLRRQACGALLAPLHTDRSSRTATPAPQETLKSVVAQYNASQLLTMREVSGG